MENTLIANLDSFEPNAWHHIAIAHFTAPDPDPRYALFVDGVEVSNCLEGAVGCVAAADLGDEETVLIKRELSTAMKLAIDDFLFYPTSFPNSFLSSVAYPPLPSVRFLPESTAGGDQCTEDQYEFDDYQLVWGNASAEPYTELLEGDCEGLLSPCKGYVGVWLFDEGYGQLVHDRSANGFHLTTSAATNVWEIGPGNSGVSLRFYTDSELSFVADPPSFPFPGLSGSHLSIEALALPDSSTRGQVIAALIGERNMFRFQLGTMVPQLVFDFGEDETTNLDSPSTGMTLTVGQWASVGVRHTFGEGFSTVFQVDGTTANAIEDTNRDALPATGRGDFVVGSGEPGSGTQGLTGNIAGLVILNEGGKHQILRASRPVSTAWLGRAAVSGPVCVDSP